MPDLQKSALPAMLPEEECGEESPVFRLLAWYDSLSDAGRDCIDQTLHTAAGFGLGLVLPSWASWAICHHREFVQQAPIERIEDLERDMRFWLIGTAIGWTVRAGLVVGTLLWLFTA